MFGDRLVIVNGSLICGKKAKQWPALRIEGFQACNIVEQQRSLARAWAAGTGGTGWNLTVDVGDGS